MSLVVDAGGVALATFESQRRDPLAHFRFKNETIGLATEHLGKHEIYVHASGSAGKTTWGAATAVSLLRRENQLAGHRLPVMSEQPVGILIVPSFKQSLGSSVQMVRQMIGEWPHREVPLGLYVQAFQVRQRGCQSDDPKDWAIMYVFPHSGDMPKGIRADFVWADEPPDIAMWQEAVMRSRAKKTFCAFITATPLNRLDSIEGAGWQPLLDRFKDCLGTPRNGRIRIQTSIYDNKALTEADLIRFERAAGVDRTLDDPYRYAQADARARLLGEHVDATGSCPFDPRTLAHWMDLTRPADDVIPFVVQAEKDTPHGKRAEARTCTFHAWGSVDERDVYLVVFDPARGINDGRHDPDGLHVWSFRKRALVGRANEYLGGWGLGLAAVEVATVYNNAYICPARGGGYAETALSAIRQRGYTKFTNVTPESVISGKSGSLGFTETHESRGRAIGALQQALTTGDAGIPCREVVQCLMDCVIDGAGKIVAGPRGHDEDLVCAGIALAIIQSKGAALPKHTEAPRPSSVDEFRDALNTSFGRRVVSAPRGPSWTDASEAVFGE